MNIKEDILNTTLKLVIEKGIHNTPMSLIAEESGVGMVSREERINVKLFVWICNLHKRLL